MADDYTVEIQTDQGFTTTEPTELSNAEWLFYSAIKEPDTITARIYYGDQTKQRYERRI